MISDIHLGENGRHREVSDEQATFVPLHLSSSGAACLVLDQSYKHAEAARLLGMVESALRWWVNQLQQERGGITPSGKSVDP